MAGWCQGCVPALCAMILTKPRLWVRFPIGHLAPSLCSGPQCEFLTLTKLCVTKATGGWAKKSTADSMQTYLRYMNNRQHPSFRLCTYLSFLTTENPMWGSNSQTVRSQLKPKSYAQPTEPPRCPFSFVLNKIYITLSLPFQN